MRPVIGIAAYPRLVETAFGPTRLHTASRFYVSAVERAGGTAIILPVTEADRVPDVLGLVHGVLLTGGGDVQHSLYGETPTDRTCGVDPERDHYEIALFMQSMAAGLPILGVCRGMQLMNVAMGGTLVQDVFAATGQFHHDQHRWREGVHRIKVEPHSRVAAALGETDLAVNSVHSQGLGRVAVGVRPVAWADDGSVEAIEVDGPQLVYAVQWHPEVLEDQPEQRGLFKDFVEEARLFAARG